MSNKTPEINSYSYPGFGIPVEDHQKAGYTSTLKKVGAVAILALSAGLIGGIIGGVPGATIGLLSLGSLLLICIIIDYIRSCIFAHRLQTVIPSRCKTGNQIPLGKYSKANVKVLNHVEETFTWKKRLISIAESSIELSANFAGGKPFQEVLDLIKQRMEVKPNLRAHLILSKDLLEKADIAKLENLSTDFKDRFVFLITDRIFCSSPFLHMEENHVKLLVIDGKYFVIGGTGIHPKMTREIFDKNEKEENNFASWTMDNTFRDTDIIGEGPITESMREQFFALLQKWEIRTNNTNKNRFFSLDGLEKGICTSLNDDKDLVKEVDIKFIVGGPEHRKENPITRKIIKRIRKTKKEIRIANLLVNPHDKIKKALAEKKNEGVYIRGYFNSTDQDPSLARYLYSFLSRRNYRLFSKISEYNVPDQLYHKKVATFDKYSIIGSYNLGIKSSECDDEAIVYIRNEHIAQIVNQSLYDDSKHSIPVSPQIGVFPAKVIENLGIISFLSPFFG